jgi:hypothetical protein
MRIVLREMRCCGTEDAVDNAMRDTHCESRSRFCSLTFLLGSRYQVRAVTSCARALPALSIHYFSLPSQHNTTPPCPSTHLPFLQTTLLPTF